MERLQVADQANRIRKESAVLVDVGGCAYCFGVDNALVHVFIERHRRVLCGYLGFVSVQRGSVVGHILLWCMCCGYFYVQQGFCRFVWIATFVVRYITCWRLWIVVQPSMPCICFRNANTNKM